MRLKYGATLTLLGIALIALGARNGIAGLILIWLGIDFLFLGIAHVLQKHGAFGKRSDGTLPLWTWFVYWPLLLLTLALWHAVRLTTSEPAFNRVSDQVVVGRRLLPGEGPGEFANIVDLTAEFVEPSVFRKTNGYLAFPVLDASAPSPERLHAVVSNLSPGSVFIHCAQGHGRTGLFALAVMLYRGTAQDVDEGLAMLTNVRPGIRLNRQQRQCVEAYAKLLTKPPLHQPEGSKATNPGWSATTTRSCWNKRPHPERVIAACRSQRAWTLARRITNKLANRRSLTQRGQLPNRRRA